VIDEPIELRDMKEFYVEVLEKGSTNLGHKVF